MFRVDRSQNRLSRLTHKRFSDLNLRERGHLQEWLARPQTRDCPEFCVSVPFHAVSDTQAAKRSPNIMANWLRAANHSRTLRPSFSKLRIAR